MRLRRSDCSGPYRKMPFSSVDFLQALAAGVLVGSAYALMCIGLGIIFGAMRVINFAQGDFLMLGMYVAFYLTTGFGVLTFLGPNAGPVVAAFAAGPVVFALGWVAHRYIVTRVTGAGAATVRCPIRSSARGFEGSRLSRPARSRFARWACTVDGEARPTASPISRTVGG